MNFPQLRMESQMALIQMNSSYEKLHMKQPHAELSIEQPKAHIKIDSKPATLTIDQSKAWEDMNLLNVLKSIQKYASSGKAAVSEGTARRAREGNEMMRIEQEGTPIISQAKRHSERPEKTLGIDFIPSSFSVRTTYHPGQLNIDAAIKKPIIHAKANRPDIQYVPGQVTTSMKQLASLKIDVIESGHNL